MRLNVLEASGDVLDWMVAKALKLLVDTDAKSGPLSPELKELAKEMWELRAFRPSTDATQGDPILHKAKIVTETFKGGPHWSAFQFSSGDCVIKAETRLVAGFRCLVLSRLGQIVEVPDEICENAPGVTSASARIVECV